jgi:predicted secreted hydrolase
MEKALIFTGLIAALLVSPSGWSDPQPEQVIAPRISGGGSRLSQLLGNDGLTGFASATEPRTFSFPADHGPHPGFRNEWWYLTGNLDGQDGERFGFELTIFRFRLLPRDDRQQASRWQSDEVYIGHFAVTDARNEKFYVAQRASRGSMGLAGASAKPLHIWVEDWSLAATPDAPVVWRVQAADQAMSLQLRLRSLKPPVLNGQDGLSRKSSEPGNASYYYSISRLQSEGSLQIGAQRFAVTGYSWLDREWSSSALAKDQAGWDWFALQLDDGTDLMFYQLRGLDGSQDPHSAGTWIDGDGVANYLDKDAVQIVITDSWDSTLGGRYPSGWQLNVPGHGLRLDVTPVINNQELNATVRYWEGAVNVSGTRNGDKIRGRGYVELTGYADSTATR